MLACGALVIADLRIAVLTETGFTCSAGVAHNKMLAKLASGMHKPAQQTLVPSSSVTVLLAKLPIKKMKQLGGKLGDSLQEDLQISFVGDLLQFSESRLQDLYGVNTGTWLWNTARGFSGDEVKARTLPKSHSCGKTFPGPKSLKSLEEVKYWISELATELQERLDMDLQQNQRMAHLLTMHAGTNHGYKVSQGPKFPSKSCVLRYGKDKVALDAFRLFERGLSDYLSLSPKRSGGSSTWAITSLFIGASNMWATPAGMNPISHFFTSPTSTSANNVEERAGPSSPQSISSIWSSDVPLSPHKSPDTDGEHNCELNFDLIDPASEAELGETIEDVQESDVMCTPTFGQFGHINTPTCTLQLPTADPGLMEDNRISVKPEFPSGQMTAEAQAFVISCSPVDQEQAALNTCSADCKKEKHEISSENSSRLQTSDVLELSNASEHELMELGGGESPSDVCRKEPLLSLSAAGIHAHTSRVLKLKDMWNRKDFSIAHCSRETANDDHFQGYKQGEIDEAVLSELPPEIQEELRRSLGCKRPRTSGKKATIGDFFRNSASDRGQ